MKISHQLIKTCSQKYQRPAALERRSTEGMHPCSVHTSATETGCSRRYCGLLQSPAAGWVAV